MAFRFAVAVFGLIAVASQSNAGYLPPVGCGASLLGGLGGYPGLALPPLAAHAPIYPHAPVYPHAHLPAVLPAVPCPEPAPTVAQKPDVNIALPLPQKISLGNYCTCQKYAIKPTLVPCAPAPLPIHALPIHHPVAPLGLLPGPVVAPHLGLGNLNALLAKLKLLGGAPALPGYPLLPAHSCPCA